MTLYEINEAIMNCVDIETGEILDEAAIDQLEMERDAKIENLALWVKDLKAEAEAIKTEKMALAKRQSVAENKAESITRYLTRVLDGSKFSTSKVAISYRTSKSVNISDDAVIPDEYVTYEPKVSKTELKKALEEGKTFIGVDLVTNMNLQIK